MQKITFWACLYIMLLMSMSMNSQIYQPLLVQSGFTDDVIAEASPASTTTTNPVDATTSGANFAFMTTAYPGATSGLPVNGIITSAVTTTPGLYFQMAAYTGSNSLRLNTQNTNGTLVFSNNQKAQKVFILATSGSAISTFTGVITFTDNTTQSITTQSVSDWYNGTNYAIWGIGRVGRTTGTVENSNDNPRMYQLMIPIDLANQTKQIKSIQFTKTSAAGFLNIFGVSVEVAEDCPSPQTTTFSAINFTGATATWTAPAVIPEQGYTYELRTSGAAGSGNTGLVSSETVTTLSKTFTTLLSSTTYFFYIKSICSATESSAWRLGGTFTTPTYGHIGSGTTTSQYLPISSNWGYTYSQQIYTKQQIEAVTINGATYIRKIRFYYNGTSFGATVGGSTNTSTFNNWTVYLGNTTKTSFSSTTDWVPLASLQEAYSGVVTFPAPGNWMEITFTTPFIWNGTDNLVVAVKEGVPNYGSLVYWRSFTSGNDTGIYYRNDYTNPDPSLPPTATGRTGSINQIQLDAIVPTVCTGVPNTSNLTPASQTFCSGQTPLAITAQDVNPVLNITYQWQESDDNGVTDAWTDVTDGTGATTLSYTPVAFNEINKYYRLKTTCTASGESVYSVASSVLGYSSPTTAATNLVFSSVTDLSMKIDWTNGNGHRRMVVINNVNTFTPPVNGNGPALTANSVYAGTGQQIIYDGTGTSVTVNNLNCSTTYYVQVYEYNRCGSATPYSYWYAVAAEGSQITTATTLSNTITPLSVTANFTTYNTAGDNLSTASPGWNERKGDGTFTATTSSWRGGVSLNSIPTARIILNATSKKDWIISPLTSINVAARVKFKAAITTNNAITANTNRMQGSDDKVEVMISTDACGTVWTPLFTFNAANTTSLTNVLTDFEAQIPAQYIGQNVRIGFKATDGPIDDTNDYDFHIANVVIEPQPACADTYAVTSANITKNSATISWNASSPAPVNGYEYEIRTVGSGAPGTAGAVQIGTTAAGVITKNITTLTASTTYEVYVRTVCDATTKGNWSVVHTFTTLCEHPDLTNITGDTLCGLGTAELSVATSTGIVQWFATATGGTPLHTGTTFTTPEINATTTYYAQGASPVPNIISQVGNGTSTSSAAAQSPLYHSYGGYKHQYIYTAQELAAAGIVAGPINSVGFDVVTGSTVSRNNFTVHIGTTTQNIATTTHIAGLTQVYANAAQPMTVGINTYPFTTPFTWDGTSNVVVQINWSNNNSGNYDQSGSVRYHSTTNNQCTFTQADNRTAAQILQTMTGNVAGNGSTNASNSRANTYFNGMGLCTSPRVAVVATVASAPELTLSATNAAICEGNNTTITVTSGATDYDTYTWVPNTGVTGNAIDGFVFNPTATTSYVLTASQSTGSMCSIEKTVIVTVNPNPDFTALPVEQTICANEIKELNSGSIPASTQLINETFSNGTTLPTNWSTSGGGIAIEDSNDAGGTANEVVFSGSSFGNVTRRISYGPINTTNLSEVTLQWKNYLSHYSSGYNYSVKVQTSTNGTTWNNTSWVTNPVTASQSASDQSVTINSTDVGSSTFYIAFTIQGADFGMYTWHIDNVVLSAAEQYTFEWTPTTNLYTDAAATVPYATSSNAETVYFKSATGMTSTSYGVSITSPQNCTVVNTTAITVTETVAPTVTETEYCKNSTLATITATIPTTNIIKWYAAATGGTELPATTLLVDGTTYYATQTANGCESIERTAVTVVVHDTAAPTATNTTQAFCVQANATLADVTINGTAIKWYDAANEGTELPLTTSLENGAVYYASQTLNSCESELRLAITIAITTTAAPTTTETSQLFCTISNSTLADMNVTGTDIKWYDAATGGNELSTTTLLVNETTYYASQTADGCESVERLAIEALVDDITAPTTTEATQLFCIQTNPTLASINATGTAIKWYDAATEGNELPLTTALTNGTTYYASQTITGCESDDRLAVTVQVQNTATPTTTESTQMFCSQEQATIEDLVVNESPIQWYTNATGGTSLATGTLLETKTYYAAQVQNGCESVQRLAISVSVHNTPTPSTLATTQSFCLNINPTIEDLSVTGTEIKWYSTATGGTPLATTTALVHNQTYYAVQTLNNCESPTRLAITAQVFNTAAPITNQTNQLFCIQSNPTLASIQVNGTAIKWYNAATGGTLLATTTPLTNGTVYYASQTENGCESDNRLAVTVQVQNTATPTTTEVNQSFCAQEQATLADLTVSGEAIKWYNASTGGTELPITTLLSSGTYYAVQTENGCESVQRLAINVVVTDVQTPTTSATVQAFCAQENATLASLQVVGTAVKWYDAVTGGNELLLSTVLTHNQTYYAVQTMNGCESSQRLAVTALVFNTAAPTVTNVNQAFCAFNNPKLSDIVIVGNNIKWYTTSTGGTALNNTTALVNGSTYYASQTENGCESTFRTAVNVTIATNPVITTSTMTVCSGTVLNDVVIDGLVYNQLKWYSSPTSTAALSANTLVANITYYVSSYVNNLCESQRKPVQFTVNVVPQPLAETQQICGTATVANLTVLGLPNATFNWYNSAQSTTPLNPSTPLLTGTYYVEQVVNGCKSIKRAVSVTVVSIAAPNVSPFILCAGSTVEDLVLPTGGGVTYFWYTSATSTSVLQLTHVLSTGVYFVERITNGCISQRKMVEVTIIPAPPTPTGNSTQTFMDSATVSDLVVNEANVIWYNSLYDAENGVSSLPSNHQLVNEHTYYAVLVSDAGCRSLPFAVHVIITVNTKEFDLAYLKYYPNPVETELTISYIKDIKHVELYTILGQKVMNKSFNSKDIKIDLSNLSSGTYVVRIVTEHEAQFVKIVKK